MDEHVVDPEELNLGFIAKLWVMIDDEAVMSRKESISCACGDIDACIWERLLHH